MTGATDAAGEAPRNRLFGIDGTVLARSARGDGRHFVLRARLGGRDVVVKLYGRKRGAARDFVRGVGQQWIVGKSGMAPAARAATERAVLAAWRAAGFDVPALQGDVVLPAEVVQPAVVMEFVPGRTLQAVVGDPRLALSEKERLLTRVAAEWARRHAVAIGRRDGRLVQAHAGLGHILHRPATEGASERLVTFDFEVCWARGADIERLACLEFAQYFEGLGRHAPREQRDALAAAIVRGYAELPRLRRVAAEIRRGPVPALWPLARLGLVLRDRGPGGRVELIALLERLVGRTAATGA